MEEIRHPLPPFTMETALQKVQLAEDAWNTRDPEKVSLAYTLNTEWRNRVEFINGRKEVVAFLEQEMEEGIRLPSQKGTLGFPWQQNGRAV